MVTTTHDVKLDLPVDLHGEDESGLPWGLLTEARDPQRIEEGRWIVVGNPAHLAAAQVVEIEGQVVRVRVLRGPAASHMNLLEYGA